MENQELVHYLKVLIELTLFPRLRIITEGNLSIEQIEKEQQREIIRFMNELPENYKKLENKDEIIASTLKRIGIKTLWVEKKLEEIEMTRKMQQKGAANKRKTSHKEIEK